VTRAMYRCTLSPFLVVAILAAHPALAQDSATGPEADADGLNLMQEGARLLFEGLMDEVEPTLRELEGMTEEMATQLEPALEFLSTEIGPALIALVARIDDLRHYETPEFLGNGDIVIRRRPDAPPFTPPTPEEMAEEGAIDL
jgi:hypothetical protein